MYEDTLRMQVKLNGRYVIQRYRTSSDFGCYRIRVVARALFEETVPVDVTTFGDELPVYQVVSVRAPDYEFEVCVREIAAEAHGMLCHLLSQREEITGQSLEDPRIWFETGVSPEVDEDEDA